MREIIAELLKRLELGEMINNHNLNRIIREVAGKNEKDLQHLNQKYSKKRLVAFYLKKGADFWNASKETHKKLLECLQIKPRRTASGVATITVMTKPWRCSSACIYCPNDLRMPKSYLADEPVCQRAEFVYFDPYLQVVSRLRALKQMGHPIDKIELIVLGGTWSDYSKDYQIWFIKELFRGLNDSQFSQLSEDFQDEFEGNTFKVIGNSPIAEGEAKSLEEDYKKRGFTNSKPELIKRIEKFADEFFSNKEDEKFSYNEFVNEFYSKQEPWKSINETQTASLEELEFEQNRNEKGSYRVVGLVIETRPDLITKENLSLIRKLGGTKVQIGIQSLEDSVLEANHRYIQVSKIKEAISLLRLFGFKIHIHYMLNLFQSSPELDFAGYSKLVNNEEFQPDEVKLYPCALIDGTLLVEKFKDKSWQPYSEEELVNLLVECIFETPRFCRISRMIRDISSGDIMAGNKKSNLRQIVESKAQKDVDENLRKVQEVRFREIGTKKVDYSKLEYKETVYQTSESAEYFLEWVNSDDLIAGFLRLSLPKPKAVEKFNLTEILGEKTAMIREVHIYGKTASLQKTSDSAQHIGLGKQLIAKAKQIAKENGFDKISVISSVGTREYYSKLDFETAGLYQTAKLN